MEQLGDSARPGRGPRAVVEGFALQALRVEELLHFDRFLLDEVVGSLEAFADSQSYTVQTAVKNKVAAIRNIRRADSLRPKYEAMFNQCVVLLVSYFGSALSDVFRGAVEEALAMDLDVPVSREQVKVSYREFKQDGVSPNRLVADLWLSQKDVSFQDMRSTGKAFTDALGIEIDRRAETNDIILGQAARHVIVHSGGRIDTRMVRQVEAAQPRSLKPSVRPGGLIQFSTDEVEHLSQAMRAFLDRLANSIEQLLTKTALNGA